MPGGGGDSSWNWQEGDEIGPGRTILKGLGGGSRYLSLHRHADRRDGRVHPGVRRPA